MAVRPSFSICEGGYVMTKKVDLALILALLWLFLHRVVLRWYKQYLGVG